MAQTARQTASWAKKLMWLILIWTASVAALAAAAWVIRLLMRTADLVRG
jgi:hypothetical protein